MTLYVLVCVHVKINFQVASEKFVLNMTIDAWTKFSDDSHCIRS